MFSWGPRAQGKWMGNQELGFLLCRTEKSSTSLSPKPPASISQPHSDIYADIFPWPTLQQCQSPTRSFTLKLPTSGNSYKKPMLQTRTKDISKGTEIHQQSKWDAQKFRTIFYQWEECEALVKKGKTWNVPWNVGNPLNMHFQPQVSCMAGGKCCHLSCISVFHHKLDIILLWVMWR